MAIGVRPHREQRETGLLSSLSKRIASLVFNKRYDEVRAILRGERERVNATSRFPGLDEALAAQGQQLGTSPAAMRKILAARFMLAYMLRSHEYWSEAEAIYCEVIRLSLSMDEPFFLDDARLSRAVCLKQLGRTHDYRQARAQVPAGTEILIDGDFSRVEDL